MCLAQEHNSVTPVRLEPAAPLSQVKQSTTEPLYSLKLMLIFGKGIDFFFQYLDTGEQVLWQTVKIQMKSPLGLRRGAWW